MGIYRKLHATGMSRQRIGRLIYFLSNFIHLTNPELNRIFETEVEAVFPKQQPAMGIIEVVHEHYIQQGLQKGLQQGLQQKDHEFVTRLIHAGLPDETIVEYTGTTPEFVQQVRTELQANNA